MTLVPEVPSAFFRAPRPRFFAHRGGALRWPENTLEAFRGTLALGVSYLETDVRLTKDGVLVCLHDAAVDRTTDASGSLGELTAAEVARLDAGFRFSPDGVVFPLRGRGIRIPTLGDVLALDPASFINIDIKTHTPGAVQALAHALHERGVEARVLVASSDGPTIRAFRHASRGGIATAASHSEARAFWIAAQARTPAWLIARLLRPRYQALQVPPAARCAQIIDGHFIHRAHALGIEVHAWTIDGLAAMRELLALGVDGIMTDRPELIAQLPGIASR